MCNNYGCSPCHMICPIQKIFMLLFKYYAVLNAKIQAYIKKSMMHHHWWPWPWPNQMENALYHPSNSIKNCLNGTNISPHTYATIFMITGWISGGNEGEQLFNSTTPIARENIIFTSCYHIRLFFHFNTNHFWYCCL